MNSSVVVFPYNNAFLNLLFQEYSRDEVYSLQRNELISLGIRKLDDDSCHTRVLAYEFLRNFNINELGPQLYQDGFLLQRRDALKNCLNLFLNSFDSYSEGLVNLLENGLTDDFRKDNCRMALIFYDAEKYGEIVEPEYDY